jgi:nuclear protein localization family protein 4
MVDHVEFEDPKIVDNFISFWRQTGLQRFGYLYGRYAPYTEVPLGIKAIVSAIYEPPQKPAVDGVELESDPHESSVEHVARSLGLQVVRDYAGFINMHDVKMFKGWNDLYGSN